MRLTVPHYYDFGDDRREVGEELASAGAWDGLRTRTEGPFSMATTPVEWRRQADDHPELKLRAELIAQRCAELSAKSLASYGVGGAVLEQWLQRSSPELQLTITEYAPETIARLDEFFPDSIVRHHDLLKDQPAPVDVHLFHRIDTEFTNKELRGVMQQFRGSTVIFIAAQLVGWRGVLREFRRRLNSNASRAGVSRTKGVFETLWRGTHDAMPVTFDDHQGWILTPLPAATSR